MGGCNPAARFRSPSAGLAQADALGRHFAPAGLRRVHSSDQERAIQTAQRLGGERAAVTTHPELREILLGEAELAPASEAFAAAPGYLVDPDVRLAAGGETPREVLARVSAAIEAILAAEDGEPAAAVVGHGCVNRMLLAHLLRLDPRRALRIRQDWSAVNVLERRHGRWEVGALNWNPDGVAEFARTRGTAGVAPEVWQRLGR